MSPQEQQDITKLRYVLYARKSTEDNGRQVRSIHDQISDCRKLASELRINVAAIVEESKSAKKPHQRPKFDQMLKDVRAKKYDAILCWHPDRLSRNMLESGTVIDMLDEHVLKDIRFHSHQFSNDANGKMLLGMLFVFSKQYSDDLSAKVNRGLKGNFKEGKSSGAPKHGYTRDEVTGWYTPNEHFETIREAWGMRLRGHSLEDVTAFLKESGYHRTTKTNKAATRNIRPSINTTSRMFSDSFYFGLLVQADQSVMLPEVQLDFQPMITEEEFNAVQAMNYKSTRHVSAKKRKTFYPLAGFVYCAVCNDTRYMRVGKNRTGNGTHVLSYRCDNPACNRKPKSLRAKYIFNSLYEKLEQVELSDKAYELYSKRLDSLTDEKIIELKRRAQSLRGALSHITGELNERALNAGKIDPASPIYKAQEARVNELALQRDSMRDEIAQLEQKTANPRQTKLNKNEFLNLLKTAADKMKAGSAVEKDTLARILFLNLRVDNEKIVGYQWKEPFAGLVKSIEFSYGRGDRI